MNADVNTSHITVLPKAERYAEVQKMIEGVCHGEPNLTANLANIAALLKEAFQWWWVGFYLVESNELVLGPFQGPVACTRIAKGKGVCGKAWIDGETILVDDVNQFPGHIACSANSQSEIVVPIFKNNQVVAVLDVDSEFLAHFDVVDQEGLKKIADFISRLF